MALLLPPLARRERRRAPLDLARERQRGAAHLVERPAPLDAHVDVHAARAGRLRPADEPEVVERRAHDARDLADLRPLDAGHRIEIDAQLVGMIEIVGAHRMRMQLEAGEVRHPRPAPPRRAARLLRRCGRTETAASTTSIQRRPRLGRALLEEELAVDAVRIADEHVRPAAGAAQRAVGDREVVARRDRAWCGPRPGTAPCRGSRPRRPGRRR